MALSKMQSAMLYAIILIALRYIISHELRRQDIWEDPVLKNLTDTMSTLWTLNGTNMEPANAHYSNITFINGTLMVNNTMASGQDLLVDDNRFYLKLLPLNLLFFVLILPLRYYWNLGLERVFPARPRTAVNLAYGPEKKVKAFDDDENRDEEVVKRWIAQGKVRRSSISWVNTFFKWVIDLTVGDILTQIFVQLYDGVVFENGLSAALASLKTSVPTWWIMNLFSIRPLAALIGFIVIPAHQRVVFLSGASLVQDVFVSLFLRLLVPWIIKREFVQHSMMDFTETIFQNIQKDFHPHVIDEL